MSPRASLKGRQVFATGRKLLLALRGVGRESQAESVRFHRRRVTEMALEVKPLIRVGILAERDRFIAHLHEFQAQRSDVGEKIVSSKFRHGRKAPVAPPV
jgi:hypothetical protein